MELPKMKVLELKMLYEKAYPYYKEFCNITEKTPTKRKEKWEGTSQAIWKKIELEQLTILCAGVQNMQLKTKLLTAGWLKQHLEKADFLAGGVLYLIFLADNVSQADSILEKFYYEMWYGAVIMAAKDLFSDDMSELYRETYEISNSFAPGFEEIPCEKMEDWLSILDPVKKYCTVNKEFVMQPSNSLMGIYFLYERK